MASCYKQSYIGTFNTGYQSYLWFNAGGSFGIMYPYVQALPLVPDPAITDVTKCVVVGLSGADYAKLSAGVTVPTGSTAVPLTVDAFIAVAVVVCFAIGWIAGAQR